MLKAIETRYKGHRFRSRLEARWAVFFDTLGVSWEYEKEGYDLGKIGWYLPDFWIRNWNCYVEIKPDTLGDNILHDDHWPLMYAFSEHFPMFIIIVGVPGNARFYRCAHGRLIGTDAQFPFTQLYGARKVEQAILAARSARFEHGEQP